MSINYAHPETKFDYLIQRLGRTTRIQAHIMTTIFGLQDRYSLKHTRPKKLSRSSFHCALNRLTAITQWAHSGLAEV
jgi:hypothetical protein